MSKRNRGRRGSRFIVKHNQRVPREPDRRSWPIVRAYVPMEDAFRASGHGTAGIVRRQPDGLLTFSMFQISLSEGGLMFAFGGEDQGDEEIQEHLLELAQEIPPFVEGEAELASRYVWGAYAQSDFEGMEWPKEVMTRHLGILPAMAGTKRWWFEQFVRLMPEELALGVMSIAIQDDLPEGKELLVAVSMEFDMEKTEDLISEMRRRPDEFREFQAVPDAASFHWMKHRTSGDRQRAPHAVLGLTPGEVFAQTGTLSMAARVVKELKTLSQGKIVLRDVKWGDVKDLLFMPPGIMVSDGSELPPIEEEAISSLKGG